MVINRFYSKTKLAAGHKNVKHWNAAVRLYSVAMGQTPRSTERISSFKNTFLFAHVFCGRPTAHKKSLTSLSNLCFLRHSMLTWCRSGRPTPFSVVDGKVGLTAKGYR